MLTDMLATYEYSVFLPINIVFIILIALSALTALLLVLFQQSNSDGIQGITASSETFFGKNKGQSIESKLKKWTWICLIVIAVLSIALCINFAVYNAINV